MTYVASLKDSDQLLLYVCPSIFYDFEREEKQAMALKSYNTDFIMMFCHRKAISGEKEYRKMTSPCHMPKENYDSIFVALLD